MSGPLETDATLRAAIDSVDKTVAMTQEAKGWADSLSTFLKKVKKDIPAALQSETYLKSLWDDTTISSTGNGSVILRQPWRTKRSDSGFSKKWRPR